MHAAPVLPIHPSKRHPLTGEPIQAIWVRPDGRVCWPMMGGSPELDNPDDKTEDKSSEDKPKPDDKDDDKPLGEGGEKALKAERDARKQLEGELADLKKNLAAAFGVKPDDSGAPSGADAIASVQKQLDDLKHENTVLALANANGITEKDDLDLLRTVRDADALQKLAARLAKPAETDDGTKPQRRGLPKPDGTQGSGDAADVKPSVSRGRERFAARRGKKSD